MLPLTLLKCAVDQPMLIELKNGDTYNGRLVSCNVFMNICLRDVICTSKDGERFWKLPECYIRGQSIKYLRIPDEIIETAAEEEQKDRQNALRVVRGGRSGGRFGDREGRGAGGRGDGGRGRGEGGRGGFQGRGEGGRGFQGRGDGGRGRGDSGRGPGRGFAGRADGRGGAGRGRGRDNKPSA